MYTHFYLKILNPVFIVSAPHSQPHTPERAASQGVVPLRTIWPLLSVFVCPQRPRYCMKCYVTTARLRGGVMVLSHVDKLLFLLKHNNLLPNIKSRKDIIIIFINYYTFHMASICCLLLIHCGPERRLHATAAWRLTLLLSSSALLYSVDTPTRQRGWGSSRPVLSARLYSYCRPVRLQTSRIGLALLG